MNSIKVTRINQFNSIQDTKGVYNAIIPFQDIVNNLKFTHRQSPKDGNDDDYFQRLTSDNRVLDIIEFLIKQCNSTSLITFPLNLILSIQLIDDDAIVSKDSFKQFLTDEDIDEEFKTAFLSSENEIYLSDNKIILIVDGQHRLAALKYLLYALEHPGNLVEDEEKFLKRVKNILKKHTHIDKEQLLKSIKEFEIVSTILLNFDIYEQGKVFADVNFNQKPVNKSLYYDIYGSFPNVDHNDIFIVHNWCKSLNEDEDSVLKGKIKMLGNGKGFVSQAFLCDSFLPLVRKGGIWADVMNDYVNEREDSTKELLEFIKQYFKGIYDVYSKYDNGIWPKEDETPYKSNSILLKTTGLAALIKLIADFYPKYKSSSDISQDINNRFSKIGNDSELKTKKNGIYYFSKSEGQFSKGAGRGLQDKLYKELKKDLGFEDNKESVDLFSL